MTIFGRQPVAIVTAVMAVLAVIASYGFNIVPDPDKFSTALGLVFALFASGAVTWSQVTPVAAPKLDVGTAVLTTSGAPAAVKLTV
jgi:hypothetical protein